MPQGVHRPPGKGLNNPGVELCLRRIGPMQTLKPAICFPAAKTLVEVLRTQSMASSRSIHPTSKACRHEIHAYSDFLITLQSSLDLQAVQSIHLNRIPCKTHSQDHRSGHGCWQQASCGDREWWHCTCSATALCLSLLIKRYR